jgi:plastocyanin
MVHRSLSWRATVATLFLVPVMTACSGSPNGSDAGVPPHDVEIVFDAPQQGPNAFSPPDAVISLASQNTVTWYNADLSLYGGAAGTTHHLKSDDGTTFDSGLLAPNGVFQATIAVPGTYAYHCEIHPGMTGSVTVNP